MTITVILFDSGESEDQLDLKCLQIRWRMAVAGSQQTKTVPSLTRCCHSVILRSDWPQGSLSHEIVQYYTSCSLVLTLAIMIITINDEIDTTRYTHHVIWRRVDPPNPCFSLCYRSQQDYLKCLSWPKRCYEERFVVVEMFDRNIQAC